MSEETSGKCYCVRKLSVINFFTDNKGVVRIARCFVLRHHAERPEYRL